MFESYRAHQVQRFSWHLLTSMSKTTCRVAGTPWRSTAPISVSPRTSSAAPTYLQSRLPAITNSWSGSSPTTSTHLRRLPSHLQRHLPHYDPGADHSYGGDSFLPVGGSLTRQGVPSRRRTTRKNTIITLSANTWSKPLPASESSWLSSIISLSRIIAHATGIISPSRSGLISKFRWGKYTNLWLCLSSFPRVETRLNTHYQNAYANAFLELLRLSSISQYREYESRGRPCHCAAALRSLIRKHMPFIPQSHLLRRPYGLTFYGQ